MPRRIFAKDAEKNVGKAVSLVGWVYRKRESGGIIFVVLRDQSGVVQAAIKKGNVDDKSWQAANALSFCLIKGIFGSGARG